MTLSKNLFATAAVVTLAGFASAQYVTAPITNAYTDIAATGTLVLDVGDDAGATALLGFSFDFFGTSITGIGATSNGYATTGGSLSDFSPSCMAVDDAPADTIAPFWVDLNMDDHGDIFAETTGAAGSQVAIIQWDDLGGFLNTAASYNFQVKMYEGSNDIEFHYGVIDGATSPSDGSDAAVGITNDDASSFAEVSCGAAFDLTSGYSFTIPAIAPAAHAAPAAACIGGTVTISGSGEPGHFWGIAVSGSNGPTGFLDLGADWVDNIIGTGILDGSGSTGDITIGVPLTLTCGQIGYSQMLTIGGFAPLSDLSLSAAVATTFDSCQAINGALADSDVSTSNLYSFAATAGDVITLAMCRFEDPGTPGVSALDPRMCVYDSSAVIPGAGLGIVSGDDEAGDCFVTGPFGAALIDSWVVPATDTYTIACSGWGGGDENGLYELSVQGCTGTVTQIGATEVAGGCFN